MKLTIYHALEWFFGRIEAAAGEMRVRVAICPDCGRNRYRGAPCRGGRA